MNIQFQPQRIRRQLTIKYVIWKQLKNEKIKKNPGVSRRIKSIHTRIVFVSQYSRETPGEPFS